MTRDLFVQRYWKLSTFVERAREREREDCIFVRLDLKFLFNNNIIMKLKIIRKVHIPLVIKEIDNLTLSKFMKILIVIMKILLSQFCCN